MTFVFACDHVFMQMIEIAKRYTTEVYFNQASHHSRRRYIEQKTILEQLRLDVFRVASLLTLYD